MKLKKLSLKDFEAVDNVELLELKGGYGGPGGSGGGCKGDTDDFGGTYDMDEVVVYGSAPTGNVNNTATDSIYGNWLNNTNGPTIRQGNLNSTTGGCNGCDFQDVPSPRRSTWSDLSLPLRWGLHVSQNKDGCH